MTETPVTPSRRLRTGLRRVLLVAVPLALAAVVALLLAVRPVALRTSLDDLVGEGVRFGACFYTPPAAIGSVFRHVNHSLSYRAGFNTPFELQFLRRRPRAVFRRKGS